MIFSPDLADMVLRGEKTQTRRRLKGNEPCRYRPGRDYAVQDRRGGKALGRIRVLDVACVPVQPISDDDAHAEGFKTANAFLNRWHNMYGPFSTKASCWRIAFELAAEADQ